MAGKLQVEAWVEGGVLEEVSVRDAAGNPVEFELTVHDADVGEEEGDDNT